MNNIEFSFTSNQSRTKFKIAWTIYLGEYPITKVMSREFPSEEAAQVYLDKNKDLLVQQIRGKVSKMIISAKEPEETTEVTEEVVEAVVEETTAEIAEEEVIDELASELPETVEETIENVETTEVTEEVVETVVEETTAAIAEEEVIDELASELPETVEETIENVETTEATEENEEVVEVVEEIVEENIVEGVVENLEGTEDEIIQEQSTALVPIDERALVPVGEVEEVVAVRTTKRKVKVVRRVIAGALAALILAIGIAHIIKHSKKDQLPSEEPGIENPSDTNTPDNNNPGTEEPGTEEPGEEIVEGLTNEEFENLVANLAKSYQDENVNLTTEDITKFAAILNIDSLVAENPQLASELFKDSTKEEFIQEAAKTISETVMHNAKVFEEEKSTENFIRISDALYGEQKEQLLVIESYVDEIAKVYYDQEQANAIITDLITRLVTGDLNDLDNGVQFGMQISIELIRSYIAKDVLSDINQDVLTDITRLNVAGIMQMYDNAKGLSGNAKTLK